MLGKIVVVALVALIGTSWFFGSNTGHASARYAGYNPNSVACPNGEARLEFITQINFYGWKCYEYTQSPTCSGGYLIWQPVPGQNYFNWMCYQPFVHPETEEEISGGYEEAIDSNQELETSNTGSASAEYVENNSNGPVCPDNGIARWEFVQQLNFEGWRCYESEQSPKCAGGYI